MYGLCPRGSLKNEADSRGFSSEGFWRQRNDKKEQTWYNLTVFFRWLLSVDKIEKQPATKQMKMQVTPSIQTTDV